MELGELSTSELYGVTLLTLQQMTDPCRCSFWARWADRLDAEPTPQATYAPQSCVDCPRYSRCFHTRKWVFLESRIIGE